MSRTRYWWYYTVVNAIRQYPKLAARKAKLQKQTMTPAYEATIRGTEVGRTTETAALRQLPQAEQMWVDAVEMAIEEIQRHQRHFRLARFAVLIAVGGQGQLSGPVADGDLIHLEVLQGSPGHVRPQEHLIADRGFERVYLRGIELAHHTAKGNIQLVL